MAPQEAPLPEVVGRPIAVAEVDGQSFWAPDEACGPSSEPGPPIANSALSCSVAHSALSCSGWCYTALVGVLSILWAAWVFASIDDSWEHWSSPGGSYTPAAYRAQDWLSLIGLVNFLAAALAALALVFCVPCLACHRYVPSGLELACKGGGSTQCAAVPWMMFSFAGVSFAGSLLMRPMVEFFAGAPNGMDLSYPTVLTLQFFHGLSGGVVAVVWLCCYRAKHYRSEGS